MEARERESAARVGRGARPLPMPREWTDRPRLNAAEQAIWLEFLKFARGCGGDPRPTDMLAWFEMRCVAPAEREWLCVIFGAMSAVVRERINDE